MHYDVSYKGDNDDRRAVRDLVQWFGFRKSMLIARAVKSAARMSDDEKRNNYLNSLCFSIEMGGVSGHPVRRAIARWGSEEMLANWLAS